VVSTLQFEGQKVALKQDRTGFVLTLSIHPDEAPEELLRDFVGARYMVVMVRIQDDETPTPYKNRVSKAAMLCKSLDFQIWLGATSETDAAGLLCTRCNITSRSELNGNKAAQALFDAMLKEYESANPFD
jgi:hypothetical protein